MQEQECTLDLNTIEAAVAGEKWALEKVLEEIPKFPLEEAKKQAAEE